MKEFQKYQHIEKFGTQEVQGIEFGTTYIFPKIDGTNASLWFDGEIQAGSRKRHLTLDKDNAGFYNWAVQQNNLIEFFALYPNIRLFGEWLVPHSLRTYKENAWRKFYVFDVIVNRDESELKHKSDEKFAYYPYDIYKPMLDKFNIDYIPPIMILKNGTYEQFVKQLEKNVFLIEDGKGVGEGVVIKNYDYKNKYGRSTWAKIVTSEFKEKHSKVMGTPIVNGTKLVEESIVNKYVTKALCDKVYAKIENDTGWSSRFIPRLLHTVYYDLVKEDCWNFIKENKQPTINFKTLQHLTTQKIKQLKPELFN